MSISQWCNEYKHSREFSKMKRMKPVTVKILEGTINSQKILRIVRWWTMGESLLANKADQGEEQNTEEWASVEESLEDLRKVVVTMIKH